MVKIITIHAKNAEDFLKNNGIGVLTDFKSSPKVKETLNGEFYLEFEYNKNGRYAKYLVEENIIVSPVGYGSRQAFRISKTRKIISDSNVYIYVYAKHISYDLVDNELDDVYVQDLNGDTAISWILSHTQYEHKFKGSSDITGRYNARYVSKNPIQAFIGEDENSFIKLWGGEIVRDNFDIQILQKRGKDKGVTIRYRKNLKGITFETDLSNVATRVKPKGYNGIELPEKYVDSLLIDNYVHPKIIEKKYEDIKLKENAEDEEAFSTREECYAEMRKRVIEEYTNGLDKPKISATVDFIELSKIQEYREYKNLEKLCIGDTIHIYIDEFNLEVTEKVISTIYDPILDKYISFEVGEAFSSYTLESKNYEKKIEEVIIPNYLEVAKQNATDLLTTALGGYIVKTRNELFILDNEDINKAQKIWRWNLNGLGYSKNGIEGPYKTAITADGQIVANFITTGTMSVDRIEGLSNTLTEFSKIVLEANKMSLIVSNTIDITKEKESNNSKIILEDCMKGDLLEFRIKGDNNVFSQNNSILQINAENLKDEISYVTANLDKTDWHYNTGLLNCKSLVLPIFGNRKYTVNKLAGARFALGTFTKVPVEGIIASNYVSDENEGNGLSQLEIISKEEDKYLVIFFYDGNVDDNLEEMYNSLEIYSGLQEIDLSITDTLRAVEQADADGNIVEIYDEVNLKSSELTLIKRIGVDAEGNLYVLEEEYIEDLGTIYIDLENGTNTIEVANYENVHIYCKYVITNDYTKLFTTKVEADAMITLLQNQINLAITQNNVIAAIQLAIDNGKGSIDMKADQFSIESQYFTLTKDGHVTATRGTIAGFEMWTDISSGETRSWLTKDFSDSGNIYRSGLLVRNSYDTDFLFAGMPIATDGSWNTANAATRILNNGRIITKNLQMNCESGRITYVYDNGYIAKSISGLSTYEYLSNGNYWAYDGVGYIDGIPQGILKGMHDALFYEIQDTLHNEVLMKFYRIDNSGNKAHIDSYCEFNVYNELFVDGSPVVPTVTDAANRVTRYVSQCFKFIL